MRNKELEDEWESEKREQGKGEIKIKTQTSNSVLRSHFVERKMSLCVCVGTQTVERITGTDVGKKALILSDCYQNALFSLTNSLAYHLIK